MAFRSYCMLCVVCGVVTLTVVFPAIWAEPKPTASAASLHISVHPVLPLLLENPRMAVRYCNASEQASLTIHPPTNEFLGPKEDYCDLSIIADGKKVNRPRFGTGELIAPVPHVLKPGRLKEVQFHLMSFPDRLKDWDQLEVRLEKSWGLPAATTASFLLRRNPQIKPESEQNNLEIAVLAELPVDPLSPQIVVRFCNAGKESLRLLLPRNGGRLHGMAITVDGKPLKSSGDTPAGGRDPRMDWWSHLLGPKESVEVHVQLFPLAAIPKDWKRLEVTVKKNNEFEASIYSTLILERHEPKRLYGNPPPAKP